jgi:GH15 family glucan-1,4-alpha-glucosidase
VSIDRSLTAKRPARDKSACIDSACRRLEKLPPLYRDTNILETSFKGAEGSATLVDFMAIDGATPRPATGPDGETQSRLIRILHCTVGEVRGVFKIRVTPDYGKGTAAANQRFERWHLQAGDVALCLDASDPIIEEGQQLSIPFHLSGSETAYCVISLDDGTIAAPMVDVADALARTENYWKRWCEDIRYDGDYRAAVVRSALVLKLLTYAPTGGIVAAATTSLPEAIPGNRNFDYRYSWVRDASFTVTAFCNVGLVREAGEYMRFLRDADGSGARELKLVTQSTEISRPSAKSTIFPVGAALAPSASVTPPTDSSSTISMASS